MTLPVHPAAEIFPLMSEAEFRGLVEDIREHGQREPIVLHLGAILDGRNRYRACVELGLDPRTVAWDATGAPEAFVVSRNLHRRHLNESQRAMIAARLSTAKSGDNRFTMVGGANASPMSAGQAAAALNINRATVVRAKTVLREGTPEEIKAIEMGRDSVSSTARKIIAGVPAELRKTVPAEGPRKRRGADKNNGRGNSGKNPERIERQRMNAEIWGRVRDALTHLTSLPIPADVVAIVRANDRARLVDARLSPSIKWLREFSDVWNRGEASS